MHSEASSGLLSGSADFAAHWDSGYGVRLLVMVRVCMWHSRVMFLGAASRRLVEEWSACIDEGI